MCPARQPSVIIANNYEVTRRLSERGRECGFAIAAMYTSLAEDALDSAPAAGYHSLVTQTFDFVRLSEPLCRLVPDSAVGPAPAKGRDYVESRKPRLRQ